LMNGPTRHAAGYRRLVVGSSTRAWDMGSSTGFVPVERLTSTR
jgi:hypothetical protein